MTAFVFVKGNFVEFGPEAIKMMREEFDEKYEFLGKNEKQPARSN